MEKDPTPVDPHVPVDRRLMLQGAALTGVTLALAACGKSSGDNTESTPTQQDPSPNSPAGSATPQNSQADALAQTSDIAVGGGVIVDQVVVTQPEQGDFKAFTAICTHQGCTVNSVADNVIHCPCHGSAFSATDGSVVNGPAAQPLAAVPITVKSGEVFPG